MTILYIFTSAGLSSSSVQNKVINQIQALNHNGVNCKGLFFTTDEVNPENQEDELKNYKFIHVPKVYDKYFKSLKKRNLCHKKIYEYLEAKQPIFDLIYFRYDNAGSYLSKLVNKYQYKFFFEHVTSETEEIKLYKLENPLRLNLSSLLGNMEYLWLPLLREKIWGKQIRKDALFGICNSSDIARYEIQMAGGRYRTFIGGDAVKTAEYQLRKDIPILEKEFKMIFLKGASTAADFNGLDRLFNGIKNYEGSFDIKLYLHGKNLQSEIKMIQEMGIGNQVVTGEFIQKNDTEILMQQMHLGISAMGLHRKGIKGTTTIKAREYFARGIPFIFGHADPDISASEEAMKYCMEFDADDKAIDIEKVINWYLKLNNYPDYPSKMRDFAQKHLDYDVKMCKLKNYIEEVTQLS